MTNLDSILKSRDITLPTTVCLVKAMVFPVVMYGCWTIKKAECWRIDAFKLQCWRRLLRVSRTARRSNHHSERKSTQKIHWKACCWSESSNTLATGWEEPTHWKRPWCWERLRAGGKGDNRVWDGWMASPTQWTGVWVNSGSWWWTGRPCVLQIHGVAKSQTQLSDWTTTTQGLAHSRGSISVLVSGMLSNEWTGHRKLAVMTGRVCPWAWDGSVLFS